jgi:hypothetical protein
MFPPEQYRAKAAKYTGWAKTSYRAAEAREFQAFERSFTVLADNEQWLPENYKYTVHWKTEASCAGEVTLVAEAEHVLRCLGAALIMQWNTLPTKLQRELFDSAGSMGELLEIP